MVIAEAPGVMACAPTMNIAPEIPVLEPLEKVFPVRTSPATAVPDGIGAVPVVPKIVTPDLIFGACRFVSLAVAVFVPEYNP